VIGDSRCPRRTCIWHILGYWFKKGDLVVSIEYGLNNKKAATKDKSQPEKLFGWEIRLA